MKKIKIIGLYSLLLLSQSMFCANNSAIPPRLKTVADQLFLEQAYSLALQRYQDKLHMLLKKIFQADVLTKGAYFTLLNKYLKHKETINIELEDLYTQKEVFNEIRNNIYSILYVAIEDNDQTNHEIARCLKRLIVFKALSKQQVDELHKKLSKQLAINTPSRLLFHQYFPNEQMQQEDLIHQKTIALLRKIEVFSRIFYFQGRRNWSISPL